MPTPIPSSIQCLYNKIHSPHLSISRYLWSIGRQTYMKSLIAFSLVYCIKQNRFHVAVHLFSKSSTQAVRWVCHWCSYHVLKSSAFYHRPYATAWLEDSERQNVGKCRARAGMHSLAWHFRVILPSWAFKPSCCVKSIIEQTAAWNLFAKIKKIIIN